MSKRIAHAVWPALMATWLSACTTPPGPQGAAIETPAKWQAAEIPADGTLVSAQRRDVEHRWWQSFGDPVLERLIGDALAGSKTLQIAEARVAEARAQNKGARAALLPQVGITADASRGNQGYATNDKTINIAEAGLQASWEVDVFGKNQARASQAAAIVQSSEARRDAATVTLLADVARAYFDIRNDQAQIALTQRNLANQQQTLDLIKAQQVGALSSELDVARAAAQVSTTAAKLPALQAALDTTLNQLDTLLGKPPGASRVLLAETAALKPLTNEVVTAAPAAVLANRPDVRVAERDFAASRAGLRAAAKEIYPTISLTGLFGVQDSTLLNATPWLAGANLAQPLLNFGRIEADIDAADARQTQAFAAYQQTVIEALADMETALALYLRETSRQHALAEAAAQNRKSVDLATQQYKSGYAGLLDLLVAQRDELEADSNLAASDALLRKNLVHIYTAAGGGWAL